MMSHVAVSPAGLGWAGLGWAGLGWAGLLVGNPINHDTEEQREVVTLWSLLLGRGGQGWNFKYTT